MKFFKWLGKSRENERDGPNYPVTKALSSSGRATVAKLTPSPTTFYPPIKEKEVK